MGRIALLSVIAGRPGHVCLLENKSSAPRASARPAFCDSYVTTNGRLYRQVASIARPITNAKAFGSFRDMRLESSRSRNIRVRLEANIRSAATTLFRRIVTDSEIVIHARTI